MIDTHAHLLCNLDDGPAEMGETLEIARLYAAHGWSGVAATPHIRPGMFDLTPAAIRRRVEETRAALQAAGVRLELWPGAEYYYDDALESAAERPEELLTLADGGKHLLIEFSTYARPLRLKELVFRLQVRGVTPIMAHPERYGWATDDLESMEELVEAGLRLQGTLSCLGGFWSFGARRALRKMLDAGLIHLVATDGHDAKHIGKLLDEAALQLRHIVGQERAELLLSENPRRVVEGRSLIV
ncbi:MAG: hypothetical protein C4523_00205 [Myxococcales bacterium]|nr:MAG: hypothetical protein C4523_00205 [Myxococcales bacterium]